MTLTALRPEVLTEVSEVHPSRKAFPISVTAVNADVSNAVSEAQPERK